ncbi:copper-binding protein [Prauserella sp. PE36]|uniref:copper-binding protein n=1 Tax=Prauserella sp. PE36 TaxID=1504709 RepID=UPI0011BDC3D2|nr:copper-binding protein [Prauserella sp. PE36]
MSTRRVLQYYVVGAALAVAGLVVVGCGGPNGADGATTPPAGGQAEEKRIRVSLTDFRIGMSQRTLAPGWYTFVVTNDGQARHALDIKDPGIEEERTETLDAGESANLTVTLSADVYDVYCPVGNHRELGMETTVGGRAASTTDDGADGY